MNEFEVNCITKPDRSSTVEGISHIGNNSQGWCLTREEAVRRIESKTEAYYTMDWASGVKSYIGVVRTPGKPPCLRTYSDGTWNNNLLALAQCQTCRVVA